MLGWSHGVRSTTAPSTMTNPTTFLPGTSQLTWRGGGSTFLLFLLNLTAGQSLSQRQIALWLDQVMSDPSNLSDLRKPSDPRT